MPPRIRIRSLAQLGELHTQKPLYICSRCQYATTAAAAVLPSSIMPEAPPLPLQTAPRIPPLSRHSPVQPPSHRNPAYRKSQLLRSYVSLLETTPLILLFQHNNLKAMEWAAIRRELATALEKADRAQENAPGSSASPQGQTIKLQVIQTNMFEVALRIAEYYRPGDRPAQEELPTTGAHLDAEASDPALTHALSRSAYNAIRDLRHKHPLSPLLTGSVALLTIPSVSPRHLKAALSILCPSPPEYPAPTRRANPTYYEPAVQDGLKKLFLLGARIDGRVFDTEGIRWVGSIDAGGLDTLRAELVAILQAFGAGLVHALEHAERNLKGTLAATLEGSGRSVWMTMEARRKDLQEQQNPQETTS